MCSMVEMAAKYILNLTEDERDALEEVASRKGVSKEKAQRARILVSIDEGHSTDAEIAEDLGVGTATIERVRKRAAECGLQQALERKAAPRAPRLPTLDGRAEANLVALACSQPPKGFARWTLSLLGDRLVELNVVESVSNPTICRCLKKTKSSLGR